MTASARRLVIAARFAGPPSSGNGGYTAGRLASYVRDHEPVTVTLRRPPPLETPLRVEVVGATARLVHGDHVVAVAERGVFDHPPPAAVTVGRAADARRLYGGSLRHPFPGCFVCGTTRGAGDGLRLTPGLYAEGRTACVWTPDASLADDGSPLVTAEFVWSALDCPGGWTSDLQARPLVLGRMTATCDRLPSVGQPHVVVGALQGSQRRKTFTASALYDAAGSRLARAEHTWIAIDSGAF